MNVGEDTTLGDGDVPKKLVQLLIVADGELQVAGDDTRLLVVAGGVASQLEDFGSEVLENGGQVDGSTGTDTLSVVALAEKTVDTANRERETSLGRTAIEAELADCDREARFETWDRGVLRTRDRGAKRRGRMTRKGTHDCAFFEPLALPPDLPPPVILMDVFGVEKRGKFVLMKARKDSTWECSN